MNVMNLSMEPAMDSAPAFLAPLETGRVITLPGRTEARLNLESFQPEAGPAFHGKSDGIKELDSPLSD